MDEDQRRAALDTQAALAAAARMRLLRPRHTRGVCLDFGCGNGGGSWLLARQGAQVTAVDISTPSLQRLRRLDVLPEERIIHGDGVEYLATLPDSTLDLIVACNIGPDHLGAFVKNFLSAANSACKPDGLLLMTSDDDTIEAALKVTSPHQRFRRGNLLVFKKQEADERLLEANVFPTR